MGSLVSTHSAWRERGVFLRPRVARERACGGSARRSLWLGVWCAASLGSSGAARERTCGDEHVGQDVKRTQVRTVEYKEESTVVPIRTSVKPTAGKDGQDEFQDKDQDEAKFKMSVGMDVTNCADNMEDKYLAIMTVKGIGGRLNKITVTKLDVMCMCFVKKGKPVLRKKVMSWW